MQKEAPQGTAQVQYEGGINEASDNSIAPRVPTVNAPCGYGIASL